MAPTADVASHELRSIATLLMAAALAPLGCKAAPPPEAPLRPVRFVEAYASGGERVRTFSGTAHAGLESRLSFRVGGTVRRVAVKVGDSVRAGTLLAELDPKDYQLQAEDAEAALARARAEARNAAAALERVRGLYENSNASQNDLDASRAASESADAAVASAAKRLELARNQLGYTRLTAPTAGSIAEVGVEANENVSAGQVIAMLSSGTRPEVEVAVPEVLIAQVREGEEASVTFDALPGREYRAEVTEVGVAATGAATTFPVTVRLAEANDAVRPGMAAEVRMRFGPRGGPERFVVPPFAVGEDREGRFVFVVEPGEGEVGIVRRRAVRAGELTDKGMEILEGLHDGDRVVTAGVSRIEDGQKVRLPETTPPGAREP